MGADAGPGDTGVDTGPIDLGMPQICESCVETASCPMDHECQTIDDTTGQRACLPTCGRDEFDFCPEGWACVGPTGAGVCFPARGCCTATNVGRSCEGEGECGAGVIECDDNGGARCSTEPGGTADESIAEICNGLDDDCDGETDEDFNTGDPCDGVGACGAGSVQCDPADEDRMATICSTDPGGTQNQAAPNDLLCNGIDDDCDSRTDEDRGVGTVCDGMGTCGDGVLECATINTTRCSTDPGGSAQMGGLEICDGQDNNCDGNTDEGFNTGIACAGVGACGAGLVECATSNTTRCSTHPGGSAFTGAADDDTCDGIDDDCDTRTDEDLNVGSVCDPPGQCGIGLIECNAGGTGVVCSTGPGGSGTQVQTETCNGVNDDCDALTDEGFNLGGACTAAGACGAGVRECHPSNGTAICSSGIGGSDYNGSSETCNGINDDCDANTDEGGAALCPTSVSNTSATTCSGVSGCAITNCNPNFVDADGLYNSGCECNDTESGSTNTCDNGVVYRLDLSNGTEGDITGVIGLGSDVDWYKVRVAGGDPGGVEILFQSNPNGYLRLEVDQGGCTSNPDCGAGTNLTRLTRNNCAQNTNGQFGGCTNTQSREYYIRVYRNTGVTQTCLPYTVRVRASATNT